VSIAFEPSADPCVISGDPERLQQVVWNMLTNAVKFSSSGGHVRVDVARHEADIEVAVSDTGAGIPPEFLPYVFDRFRQADQTFTRTHGGLGLGLAIVKQLATAMGGDVRVSSGPGGTAFTVSLRPQARRVDDLEVRPVQRPQRV
jgi:signal transduction histidine kinase